MNRAVLITAFLFVIPASAQDAPGREALLGNWRVQDAAPGESWSLKSDGGILSLVRSAHDAETLKVTCKTDGTECQGKDENKNVKFSMYFNGRTLVVLETRDSGVIKRMFSVEGTSDVMTLDVQNLTGSGKQETFRLTRVLRA